MQKWKCLTLQSNSTGGLKERLRTVCFHSSTTPSAGQSALFLCTDCQTSRSRIDALFHQMLLTVARNFDLNVIYPLIKKFTWGLELTFVMMSQVRFSITDFLTWTHCNHEWKRVPPLTWDATPGLQQFGAFLFSKLAVLSQSSLHH